MTAVCPQCKRSFEVVSLLSKLSGCQDHRNAREVKASEWRKCPSCQGSGQKIIISREAPEKDAAEECPTCQGEGGYRVRITKSG